MRPDGFSFSLLPQAKYSANEKHSQPGGSALAGEARMERTSAAIARDERQATYTVAPTGGRGQSSATLTDAERRRHAAHSEWLAWR